MRDTRACAKRAAFDDAEAARRDSVRARAAAALRRARALTSAAPPRPLPRRAQQQQQQQPEEGDDARAAPVGSLFDALPDELLARVLCVLPLVHRLRACAVARRFRRLAHTPALRAALNASHHILPGGAALRPREWRSSPDGHFRLYYQEDANLVLYYSATAAGPHALPVWALQSVVGLFGFHLAGAARLSADGELRTTAPGGPAHTVWQAGAGAAARGATPAPPYRLAVRNEGDFVILDADDAVVWAALPDRRPHLGA
jgi:hypothetical protein